MESVFSFFINLFDLIDPSIITTVVLITMLAIGRGLVFKPAKVAGWFFGSVLATGCVIAFLNSMATATETSLSSRMRHEQMGIEVFFLSALPIVGYWIACALRWLVGFLWTRYFAEIPVR